MPIPRFIADINVGRLGRWLRAKGYDTLQFSNGDDSEMLAIAADENRIVLSRDTGLSRYRLVLGGRARVIILQSDRTSEQLTQVMAEIGPHPRPMPFSICLCCNAPLEDKAPEEVKDKVPPYVFKTQKQFKQCPDCKRIYWRGTHWQAMQHYLEGISFN